MNQRDELDELLSAYFDGELVSDEQSRARAALAEDDDNQRVVEELEMLHTSIQEFPRQRLGSEFKDKVLAEISKRGSPVSVSPLKSRISAAIAVLAAALLVMWIVARNSNSNPIAQPENKPSGPTLVEKPRLPSRYVMTIELVVTEKGFREQRLQRVLKAHQISYHPSFAIAPSLEAQLLKSRLLKDVVGRTRRVNEADEVELVYVIMDPERLDNIWQDLRRSPGQIAEMKFNMAITKGELEVFQRLKNREASDFAIMVRQQKAAAAQLERARKVAVSFALMSRLTRSMGGAGKLDLPDKLPEESPFTKSRSVGKKGKQGQRKSLFGKDETAQILFILHRAPAKKKKAEKK